MEARVGRKNQREYWCRFAVAHVGDRPPYVDLVFFDSNGLS